MRVGLITPGFSASEEDWCIPALLDLVRRLAETDDVTVFALRYPHTREPYEVYGARVVPFGAAEAAGFARGPLLVRASKALLRESRRRSFHVFHALWAHEPGWLATIAGQLTRTSTVVSILGGELTDLPAIDYGGQRSAVNRRLIRRALADADRVTVGSAFLEDLASGHLPPDKLRRCPLGLDTERFSPDGPEVVLEGDPALLHVASLSPVKDQKTLLRAFRIVAGQRSTARLHIVGEGSELEPLQALAGDLDVADRVTWHGAVDHGHLAGYYRAADVFVLSSLFESQAMVVLEAAVCGCPVAGTAVGVVPELGGLRPASPGQPRELAEILLELLQEGRRRTVARRQREALKDFELTATIRRLREVYAELVT